MAEPTINGSKLYKEIKPLIDEQSTDGELFLSKVAAKISSYVTSNDSITGAYAGLIPGSPPIPSTLIVAKGCFLPAYTPPGFAPPIPYDFTNWIKNTLKTKLIWNLTPLPPHTFTPTIVKPLEEIIDIYGDLSDLRTAEGFWALISDMIICSFLSSLDRVTPISATATDGSSGEIVWIPLDIPELKHNFIFRIHYNIKETELIQWIENQGIHIPDNVTEGDVDVPINNQPYYPTAMLWRVLKSITKDCFFYKKQDVAFQDNEFLVLLATGSQV